MYADDLIRISPSVTELQVMLDLCCSELALLDIKLNSKKSNAIRIGSRFKINCSKLHALQDTIEWVNEARYLGVYLLSGHCFKCSFSNSKNKYYRAANAILAKAGNKDNAAVTLKLISSIAVPILTYSLEALALSKTELISLEHPWTRCFEKVFRTFDKQVVLNCQANFGFLPIKYHYCKQAMTFLCKLAHSTNSILRLLHDIVSQEDKSRIASLCNININVFKRNITESVRYAFMEELNNLF
jgi:hypothetical protein